MPRLSLIVPFQCDSQALENTLVSVLELRSPDDELLIVHRGEYQDPYGLQGNEAKVLETPASSSLAEQLNIAVQNATGDVLQVVLPGAVLEPDWCVDALAAFDELDVDMIALGVSGSGISGSGARSDPPATSHRRSLEDRRTAAGRHDDPSQRNPMPRRVEHENTRRLDRFRIVLDGQIARPAGRSRRRLLGDLR